ncbi:MAG: hypothetical protein A2751_02655 [Candidatus Doudnabacteria bacterium RIFCSPHIGHO2_01_FULL_46_14]|uniref:HD domain-containing protein n=1 Tax=Candidatus Doudnabacteria bacterium RIFCSPHIGHO2_01_FULL_46_14 TaxID=1817824 RepID=A0A1F5NJN3_9BACT|nr:MAG: hypothetical protein A2751_02655 [Candidatus Doudnabacteria bacterium RIFCSPHIGHO2_01_FULL_46_14]
MIIHDTIYGGIEITEPVILELIETSAMQRLKGVDQNAVAGIVEISWGRFSRFNHCVGVMSLIKRLGGSIEEQIAGLVHDISHTAFSHAMDFAFGAAETQDFHEKHLLRIVNKSNIPEILRRYGFETDHVLDHHNFSILEQPLPALCADRVDYALKTFLTSFDVPLSLLKEMLADLTVFQGQIVFQTKTFARQFADLFIRGDKERWGGSYIGNTIYHLFSQILKKAHDRGEITFDDFFTTDKELMDKLSKETRQEVADLTKLHLTEVEPGSPHDLHLNAKVRYVDPPVLIAGQLNKLSEIDEEFAKNLQQFIARRKHGNYVKITK